MAETQIVTVEPGTKAQIATPAVIENASGIDTAWVSMSEALPPPHRGHALKPGERMTLPAGVGFVEAAACLELVVTRW